MKLPDAVDRVLLDQDTIAGRVEELAAQISQDYAGVDNLVLVGVLKGAFIFLADLTRKLTIKLKPDKAQHRSRCTGSIWPVRTQKTSPDAGERGSRE